MVESSKHTLPYNDAWISARVILVHQNIPLHDKKLEEYWGKGEKKVEANVHLIEIFNSVKHSSVIDV